MGVGEVERLPHLALVGLAVAYHAEDVVLAAVDLIAQGRARGGGSPLAQGAGGQVHAGCQLPVGMAGEPGMGLVQGIGLLHGIEAHQAEGGVGHRARVTLAEHQPVAVGIPGVLGVKMHDLAVQHGHQVGQIHGAAHMAEAAGMDDLQRLQSDLCRQGLDFLLVHCVSFLIVCLSRPAASGAAGCDGGSPGSAASCWRAASGRYRPGTGACPGRPWPAAGSRR